jgi:beta-mannosidase
MQYLDLGGQWQLSQPDGQETWEAKVPGCVHSDLLAAGEIPDPYVGDNELACKWVGKASWVYSRSFEVPVDLLANDRVLLVCKGLDTLAEVYVNGQQIGRADNMFRTWKWDVGPVLEGGENRIEIRFQPVEKLIAGKEKQRPIGQWGDDGHKVLGGNWTRKMQCNFGWDWGPALVTCGIWREISVVGVSEAVLEEVRVSQDHTAAPTVKVEADIRARAFSGEHLQAQAVLRDPEGETISEAGGELTDGCKALGFEIPDARLWWPAGMGDQPLYELEVRLRNDSGQQLDSWRKRIGLRTLGLIRRDDQWGQSFAFEANGREFFAKGANWIPADTFVSSLEARDYRRLLEDAAAAHMNMLRVWGGGIYEADVFYDLCDELGICVWQDFMFACATYPTFDEEWMANCRAEFQDNIRRLRHHACIALWCGNNELEMGLVDDAWSRRRMSWSDYDKLFGKMLPEIVSNLDPHRDYWPCSPHNARGDRKGGNAEDTGDAHIWAVWHGRQPFEFYRQCNHRFVSEFGFQSFPEPRSVQAYTQPDQRNVTSYVMEHHQRSRIGNTCIMTYMLDWFRMPAGFDKTLWLSQILQGLAVKIGVEYWRCNRPRTMGALYWQLNDCWPVASWAGIDRAGRWKALHYMARRFFAPVLLSGARQEGKDRVEWHVVSDLADGIACDLEWRILTLSGEEIETQKRSLRIAADSARKVAVTRLDDLCRRHGRRDLLLEARLVGQGQILSRQVLSLVPPKHLDLVEAQYDIAVEEAGQGFDVTVESDCPSLYVWLELDGCDIRCSDNFFHLLPGEPRTLRVLPQEDMSAAVLQQRLEIRDLRWTYSGL